MTKKKPKETRRESEVRVRVNVEELRAFMAEAESKGLSVSSWLRMLGKRETGTMSKPL